MNPFETYRIIEAEEIIKANIRSDHISEDASSLINALNPLTYIIKPEFAKGASLHANVIRKLDDKPYTLELLKYFGYELNIKGNYTYQLAKSETESATRLAAANEFLRFLNDLKKMKDNSLNGFSNTIRAFISKS